MTAAAAAQAKKPRITLAHESEYQATILGAAKVCGWRTAHFRPARTRYGWRTAVAGDGTGFPDMVLIHPQAGHVWFVELKRDDHPNLRPEQDAWRLDLIAAGAIHIVVHVPSGLDAFVQDLALASRHPRKAPT